MIKRDAESVRGILTSLIWKNNSKLERREFWNILINIMKHEGVSTQLN